MAFEVDLEELQKEETINADKILNEYFNPKNIGLKTEINAPSEFTTLEVIAQHFNDLINFGATKTKRGKPKYKHNFKNVPKTLQLWIDMFKVNMVSHNRKSRLEVADVLKAMKQQENNERSLVQKLTGMGRG